MTGAPFGTVRRPRDTRAPLPGTAPRRFACHDGAMTEFERAVDLVLRGLGEGEVVTYGEVALEAGYPGRARAVGRFLATGDGTHPWWRVVNASGRLVPGHEAEQASRLAAEGIATADGRVTAFRRSRRNAHPAE